MLRRILSFFQTLLIGLVVCAMVIFFLLKSITALNLHCDLQADKTYNCQVTETIYKYAIAEKQFENVIGIDYDLSCSKSSKGRGCSSKAFFQTPNGERVLISSTVTNPDTVQKLVTTLQGSMQTRSTPVDYTDHSFPFVLILVLACALPIILIIAFASLLPERSNRGTPVISFNRNND